MFRSFDELIKLNNHNSMYKELQLCASRDFFAFVVAFFLFLKCDVNIESHSMWRSRDGVFGQYDNKKINVDSRANKVALAAWTL